MDALSDTLYYALQGFETQQAMQYCRCINLPCRQIVRTGIEVAQIMLGDELIEEHRQTYLNLIQRRLYDRRETVMTIIVMAALFSLIRNDKQASRCRDALVSDWGDDIYDIYHSFRLAVDEQIDCEIAKQQTQTYTITVMKTDQPQTVVYNYGTYNDIHGNENCNIYACPQKEQEEQTAPVAERQTEDIEPVDTSFFCTQQFAPDIIEKNIRQAIEEAKSKADVCRKIMQLDTCGYILLRNVSDDKKAALINRFAIPRYTITGDDFRKARNS